MATRFSRSTVVLPSELPESARADLARRRYVINPEGSRAVADLGQDVDTDRPKESWPWAEPFPHAYYVGVAASVNLLAYSHWVRGRLVRHLYFSDEWRSVIGAAESWEREVLCSASALAQAEEYVAYLEEIDEPTRERELALVRRTYSDARIEQGSAYPLCDAETVGFQLPTFFGL